MAMAQPGMFLSQPPMATKPSNPSAPTTVSMESAMTSRETREYRMPGEPIEIPSETVIVLNVTALPPASSAPMAAASARSLMCVLQGVKLLQVDAIPTWGFWKSLSVKPTACNIARAAALSIPSTTSDEYLRRSSSLSVICSPKK